MVAGAHERDFRTFPLPGVDFDRLAFEKVLADAFRVEGARLDPVVRKLAFFGFDNDAVDLIGGELPRLF